MSLRIRSTIIKFSARSFGEFASFSACCASLRRIEPRQRAFNRARLDLALAQLDKALRRQA
jgi:hypothetical protein